MSFANSIAQWLAGEGIPVQYSSNINLNNNVPVVMPTSGNWATTGPGIKPRAGYVRIKSNIIKLNVNHKIGPIYVTDGTNTTNIYAGDAASGANSLFLDSTFFFWLDYGITNINITNIATVNNSATYDVEVACFQ